MKKNIFFVFALLISSILTAQESEPNFHWGLKGGTSFSKFNTPMSAYEEKEAIGIFPLKEGCYLGTFASVKTSIIPIIDAFVFDLTYSEQGSYHKNKYRNSNEKYNLSYLSLGYKIKLKLHKTIFFYIGFSTDFLLKANTKTLDFNRFDFTSTLFAFEYMFYKNFGILIDGKRGWNRILPEENLLYTEKPIRNRTICFGFTYHFND